MRVSKKQQEEIDFLSKRFGVRCFYIGGAFEPTEQEIEEYFNWTVKGIKPREGSYHSKNRLFIAKRILDINIKMWRESIKHRLLFFSELYEDQHLKCPYFTNLIKTMEKNFKWEKDTPDYINFVRDMVVDK